MTKLYHLARETTLTTGLNTLTLGGAVAGHLTFTAAGLRSGDAISYAIVAGEQTEFGRGVYTVGAFGIATLTRAVVQSTNGGYPIDLSGAAEVFITDMAGAESAAPAGSAGDRVSAGPGIDIVSHGVDKLVGIGLDAILLARADGSPASEYPLNEAGLIAALADAVAGDTVLLYGCEITLAEPLTIPADITLRGIGDASQIIGDVAVLGALLDAHIAGHLTNSGGEINRVSVYATSGTGYTQSDGRATNLSVSITEGVGADISGGILSHSTVKAPNTQALPIVDGVVQWDFTNDTEEWWYGEAGGTAFSMPLANGGHSDGRLSIGSTGGWQAGCWYYTPPFTLIPQTGATVEQDYRSNGNIYTYPGLWLQFSDGSAFGIGEFASRPVPDEFIGKTATLLGWSRLLYEGPYSDVTQIRLPGWLATTTSDTTGAVVTGGQMFGCIIDTQRGVILNGGQLNGCVITAYGDYALSHASGTAQMTSTAMRMVGGAPVIKATATGLTITDTAWRGDNPLIDNPANVTFGLGDRVAGSGTAGLIPKWDTTGRALTDTLLASAVTGSLATLAAALTAPRAYTLPDASGTVPLLELSNTFTANQYIENAEQIVRRANGNAVYRLHTFATGPTNTTAFQLSRSYSTLLGELVTTPSGTTFGDMLFQGVNAANAFNNGVVIRGSQDGSAAANVPGKLEIWLSSAATAWYLQPPRLSITNSAVSSPLPFVTTASIDAPLSGITPEGGYYVTLTAAESLSRGDVLTSGSANLTALKNPIDGEAPIGVAYADAASGSPVKVITHGLAYVKPDLATTAARGSILFASPTTAARAAQSTTPTDAQKWRKIGRWLESGSGNGVLARAVVQTN